MKKVLNNRRFVGIAQGENSTHWIADLDQVDQALLLSKRVHPNGNLAYFYGKDNKIWVGREVLGIDQLVKSVNNIEVLDFPQVTCTHEVLDLDFETWAELFERISVQKRRLNKQEYRISLAENDYNKIEIDYF